MSESWGTAVLLSFVLTLFVGSFFWIYDAVTHRGPPYVPSAMTKLHPHEYSYLVVPEAPAPDMESAAVRFANADVAEGYRAMASADMPLSKSKRERGREKRPVVVQREPQMTRQSTQSRPYAQASFSRVPYGGF
jgi:hypothetical protein